MWLDAGAVESKGFGDLGSLFWSQLPWLGLWTRLARDLGAKTRSRQLSGTRTSPHQPRGESHSLNFFQFCASFPFSLFQYFICFFPFQFFSNSEPPVYFSLHPGKQLRMQRIVPRWVGFAPGRRSRIPFSASKQFSISIPRRANTLMETSGFSDTQLQVREAIAKICSNFPDVSS